MKALVTGASGFIGGALAARLAGLGWQVRLFARQNAPELARRFPNCEVCRPDNLADALRGCDVVYHSAAIRNRWGTSPEAYQSANVDFPRNLLEQSASAGVQRFIYLSSVGVVGFPGVSNIDEDFPTLPASPVVDYHCSKVAAERLVRGHPGPIEAVIVRPTITYGPGDENGMVTRLIEMIAAGRFPRIGRGKNSIHLTYIDDLIDGLLLAGTHPAAAGGTFILAGPEPITVSALIEKVAALTGGRVPAWYIPAPAAALAGSLFERIFTLGASAHLLPEGAAPPVTHAMVDTFCKHRSFSSARAARLLGYAPAVTMQAGLRQTVAWMAACGRLRNAPGLRQSPDMLPGDSKR